MFVPGKLFQNSLTNTSLVLKLLNYGRKKFTTLGPALAPGSVLLANVPHSLHCSCVGDEEKKVFWGRNQTVSQLGAQMRILHPFSWAHEHQDQLENLTKVFTLEDKVSDS